MVQAADRREHHSATRHTHTTQSECSRHRWAGVMPHRERRQSLSHCRAKLSWLRLSAAWFPWLCSLAAMARPWTCLGPLGRQGRKEGTRAPPRTVLGPGRGGCGHVVSLVGSRYLRQRSVVVRRVRATPRLSCHRRQSLLSSRPPPRRPSAPGPAARMPHGRPPR